MSPQPQLIIDFYPWNIEHTVTSMPVKVKHDDPIAPLLAELCALCYPNTLRVSWIKDIDNPSREPLLQIYQSERGERIWTTHPRVPFKLRNQLFELLGNEKIGGFPWVVECDFEAEFTLSSAHQRLICEQFVERIAHTS